MFVGADDKEIKPVSNFKLVLMKREMLKLVDR